MRNSITSLLLGFSNALFAQDTFQLAPPLLKYNSVFFTNKTLVELKFAQSNTSIYYTLNNGEPTVNDLLYKKPILIKNNLTTLKAIVAGNDFYTSETIAATFIKQGKAILSVEQTLPHAKYPGSGVNTLIDNKGGSTELTSNTWMGYNCDTVTLLLKLKKQQAVKKIGLNFLQNERSWVFLPDEIIINWYDQRTKSYLLFGNEKISPGKETAGRYSNYRIIETQGKIKTEKILITIIVKKNIPEWHPAKGAHGWMFIDEVKVY